MKLLVLLNYGTDENYHFEDIEARNKKLNKLKTMISELTERSIETLKDLSDSLT